MHYSSYCITNEIVKVILTTKSFLTRYKILIDQSVEIPTKHLNEYQKIHSG